MRSILAGMMLLLAVCTSAMAKPTPVEPVRLTYAPDETGISVGPVGALLESDYFRAPRQPASAGHPFPCRLQLHVFEKTQLAQSCR